MLEFSAGKVLKNHFSEKFREKFCGKLFSAGKKYEKSTPDEFSVLAVTMIPLQHVSHALRAWSG
jgi:hypothetical protein